MCAGSNDHRARPTGLGEVIKSITAILGVPLALFALANHVSSNPVVSLVVALATAIVLSIWAVRSPWSRTTAVAGIWLVLAFAVLAGYVAWPRTVSVEGLIKDPTGDP